MRMPRVINEAPGRWTRWGKKAEAERRFGEIDSPSAILGPRKPSVANAHVRNFTRVLSAMKDSSSGRLICGLAVPYGTEIDLGNFSERYEPGCFRNSLDIDDPRCLINGNIDMVLGRKTAGTLNLWESRDGLRFEVAAPETSFGNDLLALLRRGDVTDAGAMFWIIQHWTEGSDDRLTRIVTEAKLMAVSVNTFAALGTVQRDTEQQIAAAHARGVAEGRAAERRAVALDFETGRRVGEHQAGLARMVARQQIQARMAEAIGRRI